MKKNYGKGTGAQLLGVIAMSAMAAFAGACGAHSALVAGKEQASSPGGRQQVFQDDLLGKLEGKWKLNGTIRGQTVNYGVRAAWVLNHQFMQVHQKASAPGQGGAAAYEAMVMIGYNHARERYVAHWIDVFGGRFSETLGTGARSGEKIEFVFEYPDGPFRTTFRWLPESRQWRWSMRAKSKTGEWASFAELALHRDPGAK